MSPELLNAFGEELTKIAEYAKGMPSKGTFHPIPEIKSPKKWELAVHSHEALKRGHHFDLRLGDPKTGHAHSWAMPPKLPSPGESIIAVQQPTHTLRYMDFRGNLPSGYGAGRVDLHTRDKTEIIEASPEHVKFNVYKSSGPQEFTIKRLGGRIWKLFNMTPTSKKLGVEFGKPQYKEIAPAKVDVTDDRYLMSAKIDDAHNLFVLSESGRPVRAVSYRKRTNPSVSDLIEHTHRLPALQGAVVPPGLGGTVLRGGVYAIAPETKKATDAHILGGLLNANVWKSREKQKEHGALRTVLYDVQKYRGKDVSKAPYHEKLSILRQVVKKLPMFELPPMAVGAKEKKHLLTKIEEGKLPSTSEGVVLWRLHEFEPPIKAKFREEQDVYVRDFFKAEKGSKYEGNAVGGFTFSHTPDGPIVGRVGTGLSDKLRRAMHDDPKRFKGAVAVIAGARLVHGKAQFASGAVRAPSFKNFHLDKNADKDLAV